ncbi:MAG: crossover junction endodeoxyribonuclease RuvC [Alphaproteobacteria bacterium]
MRLLGIDPGLQRTGWGVVDAVGTRLRHVANGVVTSTATLSLAERLAELYDGLAAVIEAHRPVAAAVEETFVNKNPTTTLKLGLARGAALLAPARAGLPVAEYPANLVKKTVVGAGHAEKRQVDAMVRVLLPGCAIAGPDAADALAVAICHAHHGTARDWSALAAGAPA